MRRASTVSSPVYVTMCQPPNANRPATVAVKNGPNAGNAGTTLLAADGSLAAMPRPAVRPATAMSAIAATLMIVNVVWTTVPYLTPA